MVDDDNDKEVKLDRIAVEDLRDEFYDALNEIVKKANDAIEHAETEANDYRKKLEESESACDGLDEENMNLAVEIETLRSIKTQQIDFESVERLINFAPGDPGHMYPLHERVERVIKFARDERDVAQSNRQTLWAEHEALKAAIIPELERLEGHEKRLLTIVEEFAGKVKDKRLSALLRDAKDALGG